MYKKASAQLPVKSQVCEGMLTTSETVTKQRPQVSCWEPGPGDKLLSSISLDLSMGTLTQTSRKPWGLAKEDRVTDTLHILSLPENCGVRVREHCGSAELHCYRLPHKENFHLAEANDKFYKNGF